jgi:carbamoyl-phosphate synthase small subunit
MKKADATLAETIFHRPGRLALEDGTVFHGRAFGAPTDRCGEAVFNTSMTGYQEILTDPSYAGQIVALTCPQIGNYGVTTEDVESLRIQAEGFLIRELSGTTSNWRAQDDLHGYLSAAGIPALEGLDTRALTRRLRLVGAMRCCLACAPESAKLSDAELVRRAKDSPPMEGRNLAYTVSCPQPYVWSRGGFLHDFSRPALALRAGAKPFRVTTVDFGIKENILRCLTEAGAVVDVVPATAGPEQILAGKPDGVFLSNGPGDPAAVPEAPKTIRTLAEKGLPVFGICLGHQLLALAFSGSTYKLKFGHRGANHPVRDNQTGKIEITSQNHGFAVKAESLPADMEVTHVNLNDQTVEGLRHKRLPVFSVQYHPEASPGPHDGMYLFERFRELVLARRGTAL